MRENKDFQQKDTYKDRNDQHNGNLTINGYGKGELQMGANGRCPNERQRALMELKLRVIDALRGRLAVEFISCYTEEIEALAGIKDPAEQDRQLKNLIIGIINDGSSKKKKGKAR